MIYKVFLLILGLICVVIGITEYLFKNNLIEAMLWMLFSFELSNRFDLRKIREELTKQAQKGEDDE